MDLMKREPFKTRPFILSGKAQVDSLLALIPHLPIDPVKPLEVVIREQVKVRKMSANDRMWAGPLKDIAEQAYVHGRTYSAEVWHCHYKTLYLPEEFDAELCKEGYQKWDFTPSGDRVLVGSTTQLTVKGFAIYLQQVEADGANMGVQFTASPRDMDGMR